MLRLNLYTFYFNAGKGEVFRLFVVTAYGEAEVNLYSFIISALDGD
jgi:hypothetical protein